MLHNPQVSGHILAAQGCEHFPWPRIFSHWFGQLPLSWQIGLGLHTPQVLGHFWAAQGWEHLSWAIIFAHWFGQLLLSLQIESHTPQVLGHFSDAQDCEQIPWVRIFSHCLGQLLLSWQSASFLLVLKLLIPVLYRFYDFILYCKNTKKIPSKREAKIVMNNNKNKLFCFIIDSKCLNDKMFAYLYKGNYHSELHKSFKQMQLHVDIRHLLILRA